MSPELITAIASIGTLIVIAASAIAALVCTELLLIIDDSNSSLPTLDSTRLLARAAVRRAVGSRD